MKENTNNGNGMNEAAKASLGAIKDQNQLAIEAQQLAHFKVPAPVFIEIIQILNELPFKRVANVMQILMSLRAEGKQG